MTNETFIAVILTSQQDVDWLNECFKMVGTEEGILPVQRVPYNAFYGKVSPYITLRLINTKQKPIFTSTDKVGTEDPYQSYFTLTAIQPILDLFIVSLKEKLTVLRWPWKVTMVEVH